MDEDHQLFNAVQVNGKSLTQCNIVWRSVRDDTRLYVYPGDRSFWAYAIDLVSGGGKDGSVWETPDTVVELLFYVTAYYDGVRHIEMKRDHGDMAGYLYYPRVSDLAAIFSELRKLELKFCNHDLLEIPPTP